MNHNNRGATERPMGGINRNHDSYCRRKLAHYDEHLDQLLEFLEENFGGRTARAIMARVDPCLCDLLELYDTSYDQSLAQIRELGAACLAKLAEGRQYKHRLDALLNEVQGPRSEPARGIAGEEQARSSKLDFDLILREATRFAQPGEGE